MEKKKVEEKEKAEELSFEEGVQGKVMMRGLVRKWFVDKGFGFVEVKGHSVFCHADRVVGQDWLRVGQGAWVKVMEDKARGGGSWKAVEAWDLVRWEEDQARRKAEEAVEVAARASRIAYESVEKGKRMMEVMADARMKMNFGCPSRASQQPQNWFFSMWELGGHSSVQNTPTGSGNDFHTRQTHFREIKVFYNFQQFYI